MKPEWSNPIKLGYELSGPNREEESRILYKDVAYIYKKLIDEGIKKEDIEIRLLTDNYKCRVENDDKDSYISLEGRINKKINLRWKEFPKLEIFFMDTIRQLEINIKNYNDLSLQISVRKDRNPSVYRVGACIDFLTFEKSLRGNMNDQYKDGINLLDKLNEEIKTGMIWNSKRLLRLVGSVFNPDPYLFENEVKK